MAVLRAAAVVLLLAVASSGCIQPQRFPVEFFNNTSDEVVFRVVVHHVESNRTTNDNWTVGPYETLQQNWTFETHEWYQLNVTVGGVSVRDSIKACAMNRVLFEWDGKGIDYDNAQGDGWAGC